MKIFLTLGLCCFFVKSIAQQTHIVALASNQPPALIANAGDDASFGSSVQLGGAPAAVGGTSPYTYAWSPVTDLSDATEANPTINELMVERTYTLTVTDANDCTATDEVYVSIALLSVSDDLDIRVFPTVASKSITVESASQISSVRIIDLNGKERLREIGTGKAHRLSVLSLAEGMYLLQVQTQNGVTNFKIVIR